MEGGAEVKGTLHQRLERCWGGDKRKKQQEQSDAEQDAADSGKHTLAGE